MRRACALGWFAAMLLASPFAGADDGPGPYVLIEAGPAPPLPPPQEPPQPEASVPQAGATARFAPSLEGGYSYQNTYAIPIQGFDVLAIAAVDLGGTPLRVGGVVGAAFGTSDGRLRTTTTSLGPFAEARFDRLRVGGGVRVGTFNVVRATDGTGMFNLSAGVFARTSFDLITFDKAGHGALFLAAKASLDSIGPVLYGLNASLGVRL